MFLTCKVIYIEEITVLSTARKQTPNSTKPFCKRIPSNKGESQHQNQLISTFELLTSFTFHCWIYIYIYDMICVCCKRPRVPFTAPLAPCWIRPPPPLRPVPGVGSTLQREGIDGFCGVFTSRSSFASKRIGSKGGGFSLETAFMYWRKVWFRKWRKLNN